MLIFIFTLSLRRPLVETARARIAERAGRAMTEAVADALADGTDLDLLEIIDTGSGSFVINADAAKLNAAVTAVSRSAEKLIGELGRVGAEVELGTLTGFPLLFGKGPAVRVSFLPVGAVSGNPVSSLRSCGINQSLFSVSVTLTADIRLILSGRDEVITVKKTVPIAETVIAGTAPQVYTNVANEEDMLNLIPTELP